MELFLCLQNAFFAASSFASFGIVTGFMPVTKRRRTPLDMNILTRKEQAAKWTLVGTLCEATGIIGRLPCCPLQRTVAVPSSISNATFPGLRFESQSRQFFVMWLQWQLISINQSMKLFRKYSPLIDRCRKLGEGKKAKKLPRFGFEPQTWKRGIWSGTGTGTARCRAKQGKRPMIAYCLTQRSNGCSLGSLLFLRQDNHVQRWRCLIWDLNVSCFPLLSAS